MVEKRVESAADLEVATYLAGLGYSTSPRQVRTWRTEGLLQKAVRKPQGYARTVISENSPGTFERAEVLARVTGEKRRSPYDRVLLLFFEGEEVPLQLLHKAIAVQLMSLHSDVKQYAGESDDPIEIQERILALLSGKKPRTKFGRFLYANLELLPYTPNSMKLDEQHNYMSSVFAVMVSLLLGLDARVLAVDNIEHRDAIDEMIDVVRLDNILVPSTVDTSPSVEEQRRAVREYVFQLYEGASLMELAESTKKYSLDELSWLSDVIRQTFEIGRLKSRNDRILSTGREPRGLPAGERIPLDSTMYAFSTLLLGFWINDLGLVDHDQTARNLAVATAYQQDLDQLIRGLGPRYYRLLSANGNFGNFPKSSVARFKKVLDSFEVENPDVIFRLRNMDY